MRLFPYQEEGASFLASRKTALLADEMGLGKSAQAIRALDLVGAESALIICPATVRYVWEKELSVFGPRFVKEVQVLVGYSSFRHINKNKIAIVSYEFAAKYLTGDNVRFDVLILDEAHFLKERTTKRSKAIFGTTGVVRGIKKAIWALTGTPMPNNPAELWPLLYTFRATDLKYTDFVREYCEMEYSAFAPGRERISGVKPEKARELHEGLLKKVMLRRLKKDILTDLPPIMFSEVPVEGDDALLVESEEGNVQDMRKEESELAKMIDNAKDKGAAILAGATGYMRLRRYTGLRKAKAVADIVEEELNAGAYPKIVIFGIHKQVISYLEKRLSKFGVSKITGDVPMHTRKEQMRKFQEDPGVRVFLGNILSAGTGITLTASNQVFFCEQDFVPGNNSQAADRCHRIGQKDSVLVRIAILKGSIDEEIGYILTRKMKDIRAIIDGEGLTSESVDFTKLATENTDRDEVSFLFS
jgi:SWI/SNF-related matrix-associated actin-dependent regulator 1 of chromatin subfamily A